MVGVLVVERRAHVAPVVLQRRRQLLLGGHHQFRARRDQVQQRAEAVHRQQLRHVGALLLRLQRRDLRQLPVLGRQLRRGRDLDLLRVAQRALGEGREPAQRLDLHVEQIDAHRALLGRRKDVQQPPAHRELAAILDLVDALVARRHQLLRALL